MIKGKGPAIIGTVLTIGTGVAIATATAALIEILKMKNRWPGQLTGETEAKPIEPEKDPVVAAGKGL